MVNVEIKIYAIYFYMYKNKYQNLQAIHRDRLEYLSFKFSHFINTLSAFTIQISSATTIIGRTIC